MPILLLLMAACGGGGGMRDDYARLGGSLQLVSIAPQRATTLAEAAPFESSGVVDGVRVLRHVASADGRLGVEVEGADACLHSLDTGRCGGALEVAEGEVVDVILTGHGRYSVRLDGDGAGEGGAIPETYWDSDPFRDGELVVSPAPGWDAARIAALAGVDCVADSGGLCLLRAPRGKGTGRERLRRLLARCARLKEAGAVRFAEPNYTRRLTAVPDDPYLGRQWALQQIHTQGMWDEDGGQADAIVAVVDTGVAAAHPEMAGRLVDGWDFVDGDADPTDTTAFQSHGTMVSGIAAAGTNNGTGVAGVAWGGRVMPLRVFDAGGNASLYDIAQAIRYAAGLANSSGRLPARPAHVINLSFAGVVRTQSEEDACIAAHEAGSLVVAAVGNEGATAVRFPAGYASVLGVGASTRESARASYSYTGSAVALVAPGGSAADGILVPDRNGDGLSIYRQVSGTSFAAPHVSGVAATLIALGALAPDEARALLETTARDVGAAGRDDETGFGIVDAHAATSRLLDLPAPAVYPGETMQVRLLDSDSGAEILRTTTSDFEGLIWSFERVPAGRYRLVAGTDRDYDGSLGDAGELYGEWSGGELALERTDRLLNLSILLEPR